MIMKTRKARISCVVFCVLAAETGCLAPSRDWNGKWKLDVSESIFKGQILTIAVLPGNEYQFVENSSHSLRCDGKERPIRDNRSLTCVENSTNALDLTLKENGQSTRVTRDEVSTDGRYFTVTVTELLGRGSPTTSKTVYQRVSGSDGFAGQWLDTTYLRDHSVMVLRLDDEGLHIEYPNVGQQIDAPLDGTEAPIREPHGTAADTYSARLAGRREILRLTKRDGKVFTEGSLTLSNDGRVITETWWNPDTPSKQSTLVYKRE
jgi:hypothetical protein